MATTAKVVNTGLALITALMKGTGDEPLYLQWGTDTGAVLPLAVTNTALGTARNEARSLGVSSQQETVVANDTYQVIAALTAAGTPVSVTEIGLFDGAGSGTPATGANMYMRSLFSALALDVGDSIQFTVKTQLVDNS